MRVEVLPSLCLWPLERVKQVPSIRVRKVICMVTAPWKTAKWSHPRTIRQAVEPE